MILLIPMINAEASSNPNLFVSAENSQFNNYFSGSMVIEVVIRDPNLHDTGEGKGEPDVTLNGKSLRMVQATDGNWYAYFANVEKAKVADSTVGLDGEGLDFGVFCSRDTLSSVFGISLSETDGFAVPQSIGLAGFTNGNSSFSQCTGSPTGSTNLNNVVRKAKSINTNSNIPTGQIGLDSNVWPLIQLYSFNAVTIQYNPGGPSQQVSLEYDEIPNISLNLDRDLYPNNAEVFLTVNDFQLNQDPTDEDSWTFDIGSSPSTFYQAYDNSGSSSANGGAGLVDLTPHLSALGFEDNGKLSVNLGSIIELKSNEEQPNTSVSDGSQTFSEILTLVEVGPNSGIFDNADHNDQSTLGILDNAPRGQIGSIEYNKKSISVLTGSSTATFSLRNPTLTIGDGNQSLKPGTKFSIVLVDPDQNFNSGSRDDLDAFRNSSILPTLKIGNPITLENAFDVDFFTLSTDSLTSGDSANSSTPDPNSARLIIDTSTVSNGNFEKISLNLGISASELQLLFIDTSLSNSDGTNWLNYDLRSFANDLDISDFTDTSMILSFDSLGNSPVTIIASGDLSSPKGFVQLDDADIKSISGKSGTVYLVINFESTGTGTISSEVDSQPIIFDFFSFGIINSNNVNNALYRFELEETSDNSAIFDGTLEYSVANQLNILDSKFIQTIHPIDDQIKFIVTDRLVDGEGISVSYFDLDEVGVFTTTSTKSDINTTSGILSTNSQSYRFGQPVTITLHDPDLNLKSDLVDVYFVINDPNSENVDTVGKDGVILLEVLFKDIRYKRCTVDGVEHGGLGATGFTLVETGPSTGIFEGVIRIPTTICNKSGTELISSAGGSLDVKYYDSRDAFGNSNIFSLLRSESTSSFYSFPQLSAYEIVKPLSGKFEEIILSGSIKNQKRGVPLTVTITYPDGQSQNFGVNLSNSGSYKSVISINENSLPGLYKIELYYNTSHVGIISFVVSSPEIPDWIKNKAKLWSSTSISDSEFVSGIEYLIEKGFIVTSPTESSSISEQKIPDWIKNNAKWWADDLISDEDFVKSIQYLITKGIIRI
ncbi:MAG: peptidase [Thaumarchaeota archaeon]|nr:peptidase [Nitrososphaerota archaeon]